MSEGGRITTEAGELAQVVNGEEFRFLAYIEFKGDAPRGNHYHVLRTEFLYVIAGSLTAHYVDLEDDDRASMRLDAGDLVRVEPRCAHAYAANGYTQAVEFANVLYDPADTIRFDLGVSAG